MNILSRSCWKYIIVLFFGVSFFGCVDQDFDEPPLNGEDPDITANATLEDVKAFLSFGDITEITDELIIRVTVTADDESGNLFRTIVVEDETGGISLLINNTELYNLYPVGRRLFIKCKGLHIGDYEGLPQLGGIPFDDDGDLRIGGIAEAVLDQFVFPGVWGLEVVPKTRRISELGTNDLNTIVLLENVEFSLSSANMTYALAETQTAVNHTIQDCFGGKIILRSSGFANFANDITPEGNGNLTAIYSVFRDDKQLLIRDPSDVVFANERCSSQIDCENLNLKCLRDLFTGGSSEAPEGNIVGVVTSDFTSQSVTSRNLYLQDDSGGIVVRFTEDHSFALGTELDLNVTGSELSEFSGLLQLNDVELSSVNSSSAGTLPAPRSTTIAEIIANAEAWESTLIELENVSFSGNSSYDGAVNVTDASGTIVMFTRGAAVFSGDPLPSTAESMTALVSDFDGPQIIIRSPGLDIIEGGGGGDLISLMSLREDFAGGAITAPMGRVEGIVISDYTTGSVQGQNLYLQDDSGGIVVRFTEDHSYGLGERVEINVTDLELSEFSGLLQLNDVAPERATSKGAGTLPTPRLTTISELLTNAEAWESTLVEIQNVSFSGNTVYDGNVIVTDATGMINLFTRGGSSFANDPLPTDAEYIKAIISPFEDPQLLIRSPELDIEGQGGGGSGDGFSEDFQSFSDDEDIMSNGWTNIAVVGERFWRAKEFSGNLYAQATSFNDTSPNMEAWLITPGLDSEKVNTMRFESAKAFFDHDGLSVWISTDFTGDVLTATWDQLTPTLAGISDADHDWIPSGDVDLSSYSGTLHIGFRYVGDNTNNDTSYRIDNLVIE